MIIGNDTVFICKYSPFLNCKMRCYFKLEYIVVIPLLFVLNACNSSRHITGEVFITTAGGDTKAISGAQIAFYSRDKLQESLDKTASGANDSIPAYDNLIQKEKRELQDAEAQSSEMSKSGDFASNDAHYNYVRAIKKCIAIHEFLRDAWPHAYYYFLKLPPPELETRTDSSGKFEIDLPKGDWILVAQSHRNLGTLDDEYYYWTIPVGVKKTISLSNYNMVTSEFSESVLKTKVGKKPVKGIN